MAGRGGGRERIAELAAEGRVGSAQLHAGARCRRARDRVVGKGRLLNRLWTRARAPSNVEQTAMMECSNARPRKKTYSWLTVLSTRTFLFFLSFLSLFFFFVLRFPFWMALRSAG